MSDEIARLSVERAQLLAALYRQSAKYNDDVNSHRYSPQLQELRTNIEMIERKIAIFSEGVPVK